MADSSLFPTSPTLLGRLRAAPADEEAWATFVTRYGPKILAWCRRWGLQESDAQDTTQDVLVRLARAMRTFTYDAGGSFRGWLRTVTRRAWIDFLDGRRTAAVGTGDSTTAGLLDQVAAADDLDAALEDEYRRELLDHAAARVRERVAPHTWEAFRLTAVDGLPAAEAAARLGIQVGTVFVAKHKVKTMLAEEVRLLEPSA